jgi:hypothetical protein
VSDEEIEQMGMRMAMEYEKANGRTPEDLSLQNLGFDLRSCDDNGNYRYIEVKARAKYGAVALTPNEWLMAQRLKEEYWLYVVANAAASSELYIIQNPSAKLEPDKMVDVVRYIVKDWKRQALPVAPVRKEE